jgi:hypothetical protein
MLHMILLPTVLYGLLLHPAPKSWVGVDEAVGEDRERHGRGAERIDPGDGTCSCPFLLAGSVWGSGPALARW